jgi:hypothetical protein
LGIIITLWFVIIGLMFVAGVILRFVPRKLPPVQLHKVAPSAAARLVSDFIASSYETDFGFPSGFFHIQQATDEGVVAQEWVTKNSHFTQIVRSFYRAIFRFGAPLGCLTLYISFCVAAIATPALLYAAFTEWLLKHLLRSRIRATFNRAGDGTDVTFTLRGPCALLVGKRLEQAFHEPALPPRVASLVGLHAGRPTAAPEGAAA